MKRLGCHLRSNNQRKKHRHQITVQGIDFCLRGFRCRISAPWRSCPKVRSSARMTDQVHTVASLLDIVHLTCSFDEGIALGRTSTDRKERHFSREPTRETSFAKWLTGFLANYTVSARWAKKPTFEIRAGSIQVHRSEGDDKTCSTKFLSNGNTSFAIMRVRPCFEAAYSSHTTSMTMSLRSGRGWSRKSTTYLLTSFRGQM